MEKEQVIPDDIFMDSYEKYPMGDVRKAYQQGRIDERNKSTELSQRIDAFLDKKLSERESVKGLWTDEDMLYFANFCNNTRARTASAIIEMLEKYKQTN